MFSNAQLIGNTRFSLIRPVRFLIAPSYEYRIDDACPVGAIAVRVGQTGRPTAHPKTGENCHPSGAKPRRDTAAGLSGVERAQGRLPFFQSTQEYLRGDSKSALGTHPCGLSRARPIPVDRRHQRTGLHRSSDDRRAGLHRQRAGARPVAAHHSGNANRRLGFGRATSGGGAGLVEPARLESMGTSQAQGSGNSAPTDEPVAGIAALGGGLGGGWTAAGQYLDLYWGSGIGLLRTNRAVPAPESRFCHSRFPRPRVEPGQWTPGGGDSQSTGARPLEHRSTRSCRASSPYGPNRGSDVGRELERTEALGWQAAGFLGECGGSARSRCAARNRAVALAVADLAAVRHLDSSAASHRDLYHALVRGGVSQSPQERGRGRREPNGAGLSDRVAGGGAGYSGGAAVQHQMAGANASQRTGQCQSLWAGVAEVAGGQIWQTRRWLDSSDSARGRGEGGRLSGAKERWNARLANHLAWLEPIDVDVSRIRNLKK